MHSDAGFADIDGRQADKQRQRGNDLEVDDRLDAHAPDLFQVGVAAMPLTSVANSSGAMMVLINRRKIMLISRRLTAT